MCNGCINNELKEHVNIHTCEKLNLDRVSQLKDNAMLKIKAELWVIWSFEKNDELGFDIWNITYGSGKKVWWYCPDCDEQYKQMVVNKVKLNNGCPYCSGRKFSKNLSLEIKNPQLASQWHPTLNGELSPHDLAYNSVRKVWWIGTCGHEWETRVSHRNNGSNCPYCSYNSKLLVGFNDMWTTNPELASLLANPEDGYNYTSNSNVKVDWKCSTCGKVLRNKHIYSIHAKGLKCPVCSDGFSLGEKIVYQLLKYLEIDFTHDLKTSWSQGKRYDFHIPSLNMIIEVHGSQHYIKSFETIGGDTVEEVQTNDKIKRELALSNSINAYIEIDARKTDYDFIMNSISNSSLLKYLNLSVIDIESFKFDVRKNLVLDIWEMCNSGITRTKVMSDKLNISQATALKYLKLGNTLNKCNFTIHNRNFNKKTKD